MKKWARLLYQPNKPLRESGNVTCSKEHIALSLKTAEEGMVLLKNEEDVLPLEKGAKIALFGKGTIDYVKGGGGSGDVYTKYIRNIYEGFKELGCVNVYEPLVDFYKKDVEKQYKEGAAPGMTVEPKLSEDLLKGAKNFADVAVISISRFSGEGWDRSTVECNNEVNVWGGDGKSLPQISGEIFPEGDFYLSPNEKELVDTVTKNFKKVVIVLNVGGIIDTSWIRDNADIQSALYACQGGMEGGLAAARILLGLANPSGKLVDTFAAKLEDYPSTKNFHESFDYVDYTEDIFVGYRYFETIPGACEKVVYPFGYGLSYTDFCLETTDVWEDEETINLFVKVTNIGKISGKEVVQVYFGAPQGALTKPDRELIAFAKTKELEPGESRTLSFEIEKGSLASYDDLGKVKESAWVLEKGDYHFYVGTSVRDALELDYVYEVEKDTVVEQLSKKLAPTQLKERMLSNGSFEKLPLGTPNDPNECAFEKMVAGTEEAIVPADRGRKAWMLMNPYGKDGHPLREVAEGKLSLDDFMKQLSLDDCIHLLGGQPNVGVANTWGIGNVSALGIPNAMTADGPAGVRLSEECGVPTTAWPCATLVASTWNEELIECVGEAAGAELKENNLAMWLAPAMNIHRNPMCGRNFEYYSEDPFVTGITATAMVKGIQKNKVSACVKHFAANNKETNRKHCDSRVSERALREIYLKGFEMVVKEADPWALMSSYNVINGHRASECKDLLTGILREEWGFKGLVVSDWWGRGEHYKEVLAGNDVKMACGFPDRIKKAMDLGKLSEEDIKACVRRVLEFMLKLD